MTEDFDKQSYEDVLFKRHYKFTFDNIEEALEKLNLFNNSRQLFIKNHPNTTFEIVLTYRDKDVTSDQKNTKYILIEVTTWRYPIKQKNQLPKEGTPSPMKKRMLESSSDRLLS